MAFSISFSVLVILVFEMLPFEHQEILPLESFWYIFLILITFSVWVPSPVVTEGLEE